MTKLLAASVAGVILALCAVASPLTLVALAAAVPLFIIAGRGLPEPERRALAALLCTALAVRLVIIAALFVRAIPQLNDLAVGALSGDDAYYLGRALRARDILFGFATTKYDYFVVLDEYGRTGYVDLLSWIQIVFGPTPFSMRVVNALFFIAGAVVLFRAARPAFGRTAAFTGLAVVLFVPSMLWGSISLLKESLYFCVAAVVVYCCVRAARAGSLAARLGFVVVAGASLWLLNDLRRDALILAGAGIALAVALYVAGKTPVRLAVVAMIAIIVGAGALTQPAARQRLIAAVESTAQVHGGHVFTVGHPYKLLEDGFYKTPAAPGSWQLHLTLPQALRYIVAAAAAFLVTPLPWDIVSRGELLLLPEHLAWYVLLLALPFGIRAGWQRDPLTTAVLLGFGLPFAAAIALTNGNVGTLVRMRGLVSPYLIWIGALGILAMLDRWGPRAPAVDGIPA